MPTQLKAAGTAATILITTLMSLNGENDDVNGFALPTSRVNSDNGILSDNDTECDPYTFDRIFESDFCSAFVTSRTSRSIFSIAETRASNCASLAQTECVLSPEIGLAVPAVYVVSRDTNAIKSIIAPKILDSWSPATVRVSSPMDELMMRRASLNETVFIEFLTIDKTIARETVYGDDAFCVQLLLRVFDEKCVREMS